MTPSRIDVVPELRARFGDDCEQSQVPRSWTDPSTDLSAGPAELIFDPYNARLKLVDLRAAALAKPSCRSWVDGLGQAGTPYSKLILYARPGDAEAWAAAGFVREGRLFGYFAEGVDAWLWSAFDDSERAATPREAEHDRTVELARGKTPVEPSLPGGYTGRPARSDDAAAVAELLQLVFADYPTPIDGNAIRSRIETGSNLFWMVHDERGEFVATASAEIDAERRCAELTDCATHPERRGGGLMVGILHALQDEMVRNHDIVDLYTIARADEVGMNCVFAKLGWTYTGRLRNNCRMPNGWESMNLWCRPSRHPDGLMSPEPEGA